MPDKYLLAVARRVEDGGDPVQITVALTSGALVMGFVRRAEFFVSVSKQQATDAHLGKVSVRKRSPQDYEDAKAHGERVQRILDKADDDLEDSAITLSDARVVWSTGDGVNAQTLRLNLDAIAAWWIGTTATPFKGSKDDGGFWAVGVSF